LESFDVAIKAAANPTIQPHQLGDSEVQDRKRLQKEVAQEIGRQVISALNHLKADAQARVVEDTDPERAKRIRALADPTF
jgi:hypothetical protein